MAERETHSRLTKCARTAVNPALNVHAKQQERAARIARHFERAREWGAVEDAEALHRAEKRGRSCTCFDTSGVVRIPREPKVRAAWYDAIAEMFADLYPDAPGRSASPVDLMIAATAAHHGLVVLHDDADYRVVARHAPDLDEHSVHEVV